MLSNKTLRTWFLLGCSLLLAALFVKLSSELNHSSTLELIDQLALTLAEKIRHPDLTAIAVDLTALGSPSLLILQAIIVFCIFLLLSDFWGILHLNLAVLGSAFLTDLLKNWFSRPRPDLIPRLVESNGFSYPSGHTLSASAAYFTFAILASRHFHPIWKKSVLYVLASLTITLVGLSRIYLGVHYPSDVIGGIFLGSAWAFLLGSLFGWITRKEQEESHLDDL